MNASLIMAASGAVDPAQVKPGWLALVVLALMGLATYLLWRSMNRQIKKVHFDDAQAPPDDAQPSDLPENDDQRT